MRVGRPAQDPLRRWGALLFLATGIALAWTTLGGEIPEDQTLLFLLPATAEAQLSRLEAQFTPVGEREPIRGLVFSFNTPPPRELRQLVRLPSGEYLVTTQLTWHHISGPSAATRKTETRRAHRIKLEGHETLVALNEKGPD